MNVAVPDWKRELVSLTDVPLLDGEEWDMMRLMDEASSKQSGLVVVCEFPLQNNPTES